MNDSAVKAVTNGDLSDVVGDVAGASTVHPEWLRRAEATPTLIRRVYRTWHLGRVGSWRDLGGTYNLNLLLASDRGNVVLRVHRPWVTEERLALEQEVRGHLAASGIPVALPLARPGFIRYRGRLVEVEQFVPHDDATADWHCYEAAFRLLGALHRALRPLQDLVASVPPEVANYDEPAGLSTAIAGASARVQASGAGRRREQALAVCVAGLLLAERVETWWALHGERLPRQPIRGDYRMGNVLFRSGRPAAVLDFAFLAVRERVYDLAYALHWAALHLGPPPSDQLVAAYEAGGGQPLTIAEQQALPNEVARIPLHWIGEAAFLPDPVSAILASPFARATIADQGL